MANDFRTGGVKAVHYSADGVVGNFTEINGEMNEVNNLPTDLIEQETTNSSYQSGDSLTPEFVYSDHQDFDTMRGKAVGNSREKLFFVIEFFDGRLKKTTQPVYPMAVDQPAGKRSDGDSQWQLSYKLDATQGYEEISSLT